mgnify:CR=1 FL=1
MWDSTAEDKKVLHRKYKVQTSSKLLQHIVFGIKNFVLRFSDSQWKTYDQADNHGNQKSEKFMFLINESRDTWKNHEHCLKITHPSNDISNNSKIHLYTSLLMPEYRGYREVPYGL